MKIHMPEKLSKESNRKFREIYKMDTGIEITTEEADEAAVFLMRILAVVITHTDKFYYHYDG